MITIDKIKKFKTHYEELYLQTRKEQGEDLGYINDSFLVPEIKSPHKPLRSGLGNEIVNSSAEQIVTSNPQASIYMRKGKADLANKISRIINQEWIPILRLQNPNPFKEYVKNELGRGESYLKLCHNEMWVTNTVGKDKNGEPAFDRRGLPVLFLVPDPMVIYGSPEEDNCGWEPNAGIPNRVIIIYERQPQDVIVRYPSWRNPKGVGIGSKEKVKWFEYWDKDSVYFEADDEPVLSGGIQPNIYGFVPFVRKYSGFGRRSPDGELANLIVSDIRFSRDKLKEECIKGSNIASIENIFAHKPKTLFTPGEINKEQFKEFEWGAYAANVLENVPAGTTFVDDKYLAPPPEMYISYANVKAELMQRYPFTMAGFPSGSSGRQQDLSSLSAMKRYDTVIENTENAWATALKMAWSIYKTVPTLKPSDISKELLEAEFDIEVELKEKDPIEADRKSLSGRTMVQMGQLSLRSNLVNYQGLTQDEADDEIDQILAERYMFQSPDIAELMQVRAAEKSGMSEDLEALRARRMELEKKIKQFPLGAQFGSQGGEPRTGNIQSPEGLEQSEYQRGGRRTANA